MTIHRSRIIVVFCIFLLAGCGGNAEVHGDGTATGGDGVRGDISPELNIDPGAVRCAVQPVAGCRP